ncbi:MAG: cation acetate symporter, partial [Proteobacteria bacterium]|nr:cation acetate symporter [Pseudomonadota bacterium]
SGLIDKQELLFARISAAVAIGIAGYLGINPPGLVAQVVAFAFGLAAASLFPAILLGIFSKTTTREGAITGMLLGLILTASYIIYFKTIAPELNTAEHWWFGVSPEGIGVLGAAVNFATAFVVSRFNHPVPTHVVDLIDNIRIPAGVTNPHDH